MRTVLITGGTGIIGKTLVKQLIHDGYKVVFTSRSKEKALEVFEKEGITLDITSIIEVDFNSPEALSEIKNQLEYDVDAVIHNARTIDSLKVNEKGRVTSRQFEQEMHMGITFPYELTNALLDWGNDLRDVIFISSMYGIVAPTPSLYTDFHQQSPINYGVVKAAQVHLTKELAVRLAEKNTRVNCVTYGGVEGRADEDFKKRYAQLNPMNRMLNDKDIYPPIQYVLNNPDLCITGENIKVDGGWTLW